MAFSERRTISVSIITQTKTQLYINVVCVCACAKIDKKERKKKPNCHGLLRTTYDTHSTHRRLQTASTVENRRMLRLLLRMRYKIAKYIYKFNGWLVSYCLAFRIVPRTIHTHTWTLKNIENFILFSFFPKFHCLCDFLRMRIEQRQAVSIYQPTAVDF